MIEKTRFFLRIQGRVWEECTESEFRQAERSVGLRPTAGFTSGSLQGTTMYRQVYFDWSAGARLLTPLEPINFDNLEMQRLGAFFCQHEGDEAAIELHIVRIEFHIKNGENTLAMIENGTLVLTDNETNQSKKTLESNLRQAIAIMRRNLDNKTFYSEISK